MLILTIRTDKPEAEIGLFEDDEQLKYEVWQAHRQLAETIHKKIDDVFEGQSLQDLDGIVCFQGPGSFTGLRIGLSVGNALAYSLDIPVVAEQGEGWIKTGVEKIKKGETCGIAIPEYGAPANTTKPKR